MNGGMRRPRIGGMNAYDLRIGTSDKLYPKQYVTERGDTYKGVEPQPIKLDFIIYLPLIPLKTTVRTLNTCL